MAFIYFELYAKDFAVVQTLELNRISEMNSQLIGGIERCRLKGSCIYLCQQFQRTWLLCHRPLVFVHILGQMRTEILASPEQ